MLTLSTVFAWQLDLADLTNDLLHIGWCVFNKGSGCWLSGKCSAGSTPPALEVQQCLSQRLIKCGFAFQHFVNLIIKALNKVVKKAQHPRNNYKTFRRSELLTIISLLSIKPHYYLIIITSLLPHYYYLIITSLLSSNLIIINQTSLLYYLSTWRGGTVLCCPWEHYANLVSRAVVHLQAGPRSQQLAWPRVEGPYARDSVGWGRRYAAAPIAACTMGPTRCQADVFCPVHVPGHDVWVLPPTPSAGWQRPARCICQHQHPFWDGRDAAVMPYPLTVTKW